MKKDTSSTTMLVISMGFLGLYLIFAWKWAVFVSLAVGLTGILSDVLSKKIEWAWMKLSRILSYIVPSILLGLLFYLFLFPLSLLSKLFTKDPLMLSDKYSSYFVNVERKIDKASMEKPW